MPRRVRTMLAASLLLAGILACTLLAVSGCTGVITAPAEPADPVPVFLADHGRHAGLVLVDPEGGMVEFAYGEWAWFARGRTLLIRGFPVLFWPTQATLARRDMEGPATAESVRRQAHPLEVLRIEVARADAEALRARLEARFASAGTEPVVNEDLPGLRFVPTTPAYSIAHHCNTETVAWLRALGCRVSATPLVADFEIRDGSPSASR